MEKLDPATDGQSMDLTHENLKALESLFPEAFREGKVDFDVLREVLGDAIDDRPERYGLSWNGKSEARRIAQTPSAATLRPVPEDSVNWDSTGNLFIEGDNLEVLKLLQKSYHRRVKLIYIDPPYNTGKEFIYPDRYQDNLDTYMRFTGQVDDEGFKLSPNPETDGRFHTKWLRMMYPRLRLARNLMADDGFIAVSIDDNELANLKLLLDEIFGVENFVACVTRPTGTSTGGDRDEFVSEVDYILVFRRTASAKVRGLPLSEQDAAIYDQQDQRGRYLIRSLRRTGGENRREDRPSMFYPLTAPDGSEVLPYGPASDGRYESRWVCGPETYEQLVKEGLIEWHQRPVDVLPGDESPSGATEWKVYQKFYLEGRTKQPSDLWKGLEGNKKATRKLRALFDGRKVFDHPKPLDLLCRILDVSGCEDNDIVLDFFAGAGTTGHTVMQRNCRSSAAVRFVLVQLPEPTEEASGPYKAGFRSISEIAIERLRRVAHELRAGQLDLLHEGHADLGFRVFKLDTSNIKPWDASYGNVEGALQDAIENIKADRTEKDVLHELLLKYGLDLAIPVEERTIEGKKVYILGAGALVVCLADHVGLDVVEGIAALKDELQPEIMRVVFRDSSFEDDVAKTNAVQILRQAGIDDVKSL